MAPKRDRGTSFFSPSKANKKARSGLSEDDADRALDSEVMTKMLTEQATILQSLNGYASDLMGKEISNREPKVILKLLMCEGWLDNEGRITSKEGDITVIWKDIKVFNNDQSRALVNGMTPDIEEIELGEITGNSCEDLAKEFNLKMKVVETTTNKLIKNTIKTKEKSLKMSRSSFVLTLRRST